MPRFICTCVRLKTGDCCIHVSMTLHAVNVCTLSVKQLYRFRSRCLDSTEQIDLINVAFEQKSSAQSKESDHKSK